MVSIEAAAVSAAVSGMLKIVGNKLAPLAIKEYSSIVGVEKDLQELQDLAEQINHWLETAGDKAMGDAPSFNWLKNLKDVAYDVDDVVDEFQSEAEKHNTYGDGCIVSKKTKSVISRWKAAKKIKKIKKRFAAIVKQRTDVSAIANSFPAGQSVHHMNPTTVDIPSPIVDAASVLGRDQDKSKIITNLLENKDQQEIEIVSVTGLGGSGKTTLAKLVFNDGDIIEKHFEVRLWVHVSQEFNVIKLVEKLFEAATEDKSDHRPLQHMSKKILEKLTGKRFLLVLDDVWTEDRIQWEQFIVHLKSGAPGSKILLTTRSTRVAEAVDSTVLFDLPLLSLDDSWQLFARSFGAGVTGLGSDLQEVGKEIVEKCGGVPLAIKVLASVLRDKEQIGEWQAMKDNSLLDVEGKEHRIFACLKLSYFHLPSHLKPCFTICSLFPKGYMIDKEQLIDLWIAHDMIAEEDGVSYLEYTAQKHFNSLVQMSLLQDVSENYFDSRVECRMHDLVHDLARSILDDEISLDVARKKTNFIKTYRYFSLIEELRNPLPENLFEKAHAVYVAGHNNGRCDKAWKNAKRLRSINVNCVHTESVLMAILQIKNLRYLEVPRLQCEALPEAISNIWSLQALHLRSSDILKLPKSIGKLQKLRTLNLSWCEKLKCLPDSIGDCQIISTIDLTHCNKLTVLPNSIGRNEKLRVLRLVYTKVERLPSSVTALRNLECLDLRGCGRLVELPEGIGNLEKLQVLNLEGCENLGGVPVGIGQLNRLQKLGLFVVGEGEKFAGISELANLPRIGEKLSIRGISHGMDPDDARMVCLKQRTNLQSLELWWGDADEVNTELEQAVLDGLEPPSGLKELNIHGYSGRRYAWWMHNQVDGGEQGLPYFPFLRVMKLWNFPNLKHLHGLVELPSLEELEFVDMPCLESISRGPFPSLRSLQCLTIKYCRSLSILPQSMGHLTSLRKLLIQGCPALHQLPECLGELRSLRKLCIYKLPGLTCLPQSMCGLTSLEELSIQDCRSLSTLPQSMGHLTSLQVLDIYGLPELTCLPQSMGHLTSLQKLLIGGQLIGGCPALHQLPDCLGELRSLRELFIFKFPGLTCLPQSMCGLTSLEMLHIWDCPGLTSLPQGIKGLTSLQKLFIWKCCDLARRCERGKGEDWHLISHIPDLTIH